MPNYVVNDREGVRLNIGDRVEFTSGSHGRVIGQVTQLRAGNVVHVRANTPDPNWQFYGSNVKKVSGKNNKKPRKSKKPQFLSLLREALSGNFSKPAAEQLIARINREVANKGYVIHTKEVPMLDAMKSRLVAKI